MTTAARLVLTLAALLLWVCCSAADAAQPGSRNYLAQGLTRRTVYHSPQTPGYTSWVGGWAMPDGAVMICLTQATGPVRGRAHADEAVLKRLGIRDGGYDFTGLDRRQVYLRSADGGAHWTKVGESPFGGVGASTYAGGATLALPDGAVIRRVNGWDLQGQTDGPPVPPTAYLQRSDDGCRTWRPPRVLLDPAKWLYQLSRIRRLRDGRVLARGQAWPVPAGSAHAEIDKVRPQLLLLASSDSCRTWRRLDVVPPAQSEPLRDVAWDEWDFAELPGGDLLCVFRRGDPDHPKREVRWQGVLEKRGEGWTLARLRPSPLPHSGHPELLATREGVVLYVATTGVQWTADAGESWHALVAPGFGDYRSRYYPRSLQAADGTIYVFGHNGSDNRYGEFDQSIDMDMFRLREMSNDQ